MLFYFKLCKNAAENVKAKTFGQFMDKVMQPIKRIIHGLQNFTQEMLNDAPNSGRPVKANTSQLNRLFENNKCYRMREIDQNIQINV